MHGIFVDGLGVKCRVGADKGKRLYQLGNDPAIRGTCTGYKLHAVNSREGMERRGLGARGAFTSLFDLAFRMKRSPDGVEDTQTDSSELVAVQRVFKFGVGHAKCTASVELEEKFGIRQENDQMVVCVTDRWTGTQVWWNAVRTLKPQTFKAKTHSPSDSTQDGNKCDFCRWETLTAVDTFGRVENESCITASNLFKYAFPCHGLVLFKHHNPLEFSETQVADLLSAASTWFGHASAEQPQAQWPFLIWNCLARAGASQFHGHAQTMLTEDPTPAASAWSRSLSKFQEQNQGSSYPEAVREAHESIGLLRKLCKGNDQSAFCFASLSPTKDMELVIHGRDLTCPAFAQLMYGCLRTLVDKLGATSFNVGVLGISLPGLPSPKGPIYARLVSRGKLSSQASDYGGLEVFGQASIGHTDPYQVIKALDVQMEGLEGYNA